MREARSTTAFVALSLVLLAGACAEEPPAAAPEATGATTAETEEADEGSITIAGQEATNHGSEDVSGASEVEVEVDDFYFEPTVLEGEAGQRLSVSLHNEGNAPHTFTIESQDVDVQLEGGESGEAEVTFPDSGALAFICRFHVGGGMLGGLSVGGDLEEASSASGGGSPSGPGYPSVG
jgi:plastocyanin